MEAKKFLETDYLDIVFENRNKAYGSYELRKNYTSRIKKAGLFLTLGIASLVCFSFINANRKVEIKPDIVYKEIKLAEVNTIPPPPAPKLPATPPPPATTAAPTKALTIPKIVDNNEIIDKEMATVDELKNFNPGLANSKGDSTTLGSETVTTSGPTTPTATPKLPMTFVEQMPAFAGDLNKYLSDNIRYPASAREAGIQGRVIIQFIVNEDGSVSDIKLGHGIGAGCDEEAIRVIKAMPKWKPGKNNGIPVKVYYNQPIAFHLD